MAATVWRLTSLVLAEGVDLRVRAARIFANGIDVTASAVVSASFIPVSGSLDALTDGDADTECVWSAQQVQQPGFYVQWAFSAAVQVDGLQLEGVDCYAAVLSGGADAISSLAPLAQGGVQMGGLPWSARGALPLSPVGFWTLSEEAASQPDEVGARIGTRNGGAVVSAQLASGGVRAYEPRGSGYIRIPGVTGVDAAAFTVVVDFQYTELDNKVLIEHGGNNMGWSVQSTSSALASNVGGPAGCLAINIGIATAPWGTTIAVNDGRPHRLALVVQPNGSAKVYIDGVDRTIKSNPGAIYPPAYNTSYIDVGSRGGVAALATGGKLAHFALLDRALTASEVRSMAEAVKWPIAARPALQWLAETSEPVPQNAATPVVRSTVMDMEFGGYGYIYGTVELYAQAGNIPLPRRVRLHRSRDGILVRETWSDAQGNYRFDGITERYTYDVIAWDHEGLQQSVVANDLTPEVMP